MNIPLSSILIQRLAQTTRFICYTLPCPQETHPYDGLRQVREKDWSYLHLPPLRRLFVGHRVHLTAEAQDMYVSELLT